MEIRGVLPHRYPFLLVDRVIEVSEDGTRGVAIKNVSANEPFFQGHFPDYPIMPGVLIVEALAQAGGATLLGRVEREGKLAMLAGIDGFRFRRPVVPGDQLRLEVTLEKVRGPIGRIRGRATVEGQLVAEGEITFAIADKPSPPATAGDPPGGPDSTPGAL
jgi:3-hydroxyacyl-[acyl-carrier-protein] dehydratase